MAREVSAAYEAKEVGKVRKPVDLYDIWNPAFTYYLTSADESIVYGGNTYAPTMINRGGTEHNSSLEVSRCTINITSIQEEVQRYIQAAPLDLTWVRVMKAFRNQNPTEVMVHFVGTVAAVSFKGKNATLRCDGLEKQLMIPIPLIRYQRLCPHTLYDQYCGVNAASFEATADLTSMSADGVTLTSADFSALDNLAFGWLVFNNYRRMIVSHEDNVITLRNFLPGLTGTDTVTVYPGCNKTMDDCRDKFFNLNNPVLDRFGGYPYIPFDNPVTWD